MRNLPLFLCILLSAFFVYFPVTDADIFWHLAAGREIFGQKHFLYTDPFSYTLVSPQWIDLHWLFQLLCYGMYSIGAEQGLIILKLLFVSFTAALLCLTHRQKRYLLFCAFLTPILLYQVRYCVDVRPVLVTVFFTTVYVFLFERARLTGKHGLLWWCVPFQIIWTNCQGLYMIGLFIIGAYWIEAAVDFLREKNGRPVLHMVVMLACAGSCLINPCGVSGLLLPFELFSRIVPDAKNIFSLNITENIPLFSLGGYDAGYRTLVIVTALTACLLLVLNRKNIRISHLVLFSGFLFLACCAVRNVLLYVVAVIPIICHYASTADLWKRFDALRPCLRSVFLKAAWAFAFLMLLVPAYRHASIASLCLRHGALSPFRFPEKITELIKRNPVPGNMFNDIRYGGYLMWHLYPGKKVFIDTRLVIRPPEFFAEYLAISEHPELFAQVAEKFTITHAILPSALFTRHMKLINWLYYSGSWRLEYADGVSVLFVRSDVPHGQFLDLSSDTTVFAVMDSIGCLYAAKPALYREGLSFFTDLLDSLGLDSAATRVRNRERIKAGGAS
jgi:hypothetical protein